MTSVPLAWALRSKCWGQVLHRLAPIGPHRLIGIVAGREAGTNRLDQLTQAGAEGIGSTGRLVGAAAVGTHHQDQGDAELADPVLKGSHRSPKGRITGGAQHKQIGKGGSKNPLRCPA